MQETLETQVQSLDQEDPLQKDTATHSNILAGRIPWAEELGVEGGEATVHRVAKSQTPLKQVSTHPKPK